ncbi:hypothetical protein A1O1_03347 [Capronia coronata CBS 617.96]|uniref:Uncharacterized protein n=1 Tax=Capronia coronata CBS 617.96 TaxID=1182541 RepID=W9YCJ1_9EURO|nr:uncharacterized protein A1O1_03347 [Capronia coronata CBS 617.96]EXJ90248.1 hypothetical protein A1O1_03347 [Capronia coronata CBS 617.96]
MDPVSVISLISFAGRCSDLLGKWIKTIRNAPNEILSLHNELSDLKMLLVEYEALKPFLCPERDCTDVGYHSSETAFTACLAKIRSIFQELNVLLETVLEERPSLDPQFQRHRWLRKRNSASRLQQELGRARQTLRDVINSASMTPLGRIDLRLESIRAVLSTDSSQSIHSPVDDVGPPLTAEAVPLALEGLRRIQGHSAKVFTVTAYRRSPCDLRCRCSCHTRSPLSQWNVLPRIIGTIFVGYTGLPTLGARCDSGSCYQSQVQAIQVVYTFPSWFMQRTLDLVGGKNSQGDPECSITLRNRVEYTLDNSLFQLARNGNVDAMKLKLNQHCAHPNDLSLRGGQTAFDWGLQYAIRSNNLDPCRILVAAGADLEIEDDYEMNSALIASDVMFTGQYQPIEAGLSELPSNVDLMALWNFSHLHRVVLGILPLDLTTEIKNLTHRSHIDARDSQRRSCLHWAASRGDAAATQTLLLAGGDPKAISLEGRTPLHYAVQAGSVHCVDLLLLAGCDVHLKDKRGDDAILVAAWASDAPLMIETLVKAGANIMSHNAGGVTCLQSAACLNHAGNVAALLDLGADIDAFDQNGDTPLFETIYYDCKQAFETLLQRRIDWTHRRRDGSTILHIVALHGGLDTIKAVGPHIAGVDLSLANAKGQTALEMLADRLVPCEEFSQRFRMLIETLSDLTDSASEGNFESALEVQLDSGTA